MEIALVACRWAGGACGQARNRKIGVRMEMGRSRSGIGCHRQVQESSLVHKTERRWRRFGAGRHTSRQMYGMGRGEDVRELFPSPRVRVGLVVV